MRRSLFIGLGGTGIRTIVQTKKLFLEAYGNIPPEIGLQKTDETGSVKTVILGQFFDF
jgi:hypothetical protein